MRNSRNLTSKRQTEAPFAYLHRDDSRNRLGFPCSGRPIAPTPQATAHCVPEPTRRRSKHMHDRCGKERHSAAQIHTTVNTSLSHAAHARLQADDTRDKARTHQRGETCVHKSWSRMLGTVRWESGMVTSM